MRVVYLRGRVSIGPFCQGECQYRTILLGGVLVYFEGCSEDSMYLFYSFFLDTLLLYMRSCDHLQTYIVLISFFILMYVFHSPTLSCVVSFLPLYTCFLYLYAIYYFCFTQRCLDEFCLKCFRNTGCQSLLAINSLLAKFFKSLCQDRFYYIQQVYMS